LSYCSRRFREYVKDLHYADFAIFFELEMDDEERAELNQDLSVAIEKGYIRLKISTRYETLKCLI
jgi:hypothetical protein